MDQLTVRFRSQSALSLGVQLLVFATLSLCSATSFAQSCPDDAPLYCNNCGGYCCEQSHPYCTSDCQCAASSSSCPDSAPRSCDNCGGYCCPDSKPYCTQDCQCSASSSSSGGGGGGSTCPANAPRSCDNCGGYCCPESQPYCTADCQCSASSSSCPASAPIACDNCGGYCCPESQPYCTQDCQCSAGSSPGGGGSGDFEGDCDAGTYACGPDFCVPDDVVCCASVGHPGEYCPSGTTCTADGRCSRTGAGSGDPAPGDSRSMAMQTPSASNDGYTCWPVDLSPCSARFCVNPDLDACYYEVDGEEVTCGGCSADDDASLTECAGRAHALCSGDAASDEDEAAGGCSTTGSGTAADASLLAIACAALLRRRRSQSSKRT